MKKLFICMLFACVAMFATSCKNTKPEIKFNLDLVGNVADSVSAVHFDFNSNVSNVIVDTTIVGAPAMFVATANPSELQVANATDWLDTYMQENILSQKTPSTKYEIIVKGFVHESVSGVTIAVDKTYTNK